MHITSFIYSAGMYFQWPLQYIYIGDNPFLYIYIYEPYHDIIDGINPGPALGLYSHTTKIPQSLASRAICMHICKFTNRARVLTHARVHGETLPHFMLQQQYILKICAPPCQTRSVYY